MVLTLADADLPAEKLLLPVSCVVMGLVSMGVAAFAARGLPAGRRGPMVLGAMIPNTAFTLPFVAAGFGQDGLTDLVLFDLGNMVVVTLIAVRLGGLDADLAAALRRAATSPMTAALVVGVALNTAGVALPTPVTGFLSPLAGLVGPVVLLALGVLFRPSADDLGYVGTAVAIRMVGGLASLDTEAAARIVSASMFVGMVAIPVAVSLL